MCDALSRNVPKLAAGSRDPGGELSGSWKTAVCGSRGELPRECRYVLEKLGEVYRIDAEARERGLTAEERLRFHQEQQRAGDGELHEWLEAQFAERKTEPNSGLGKAIRYLLRHWKPLTLFLRQAGAPLDNNLVERALKTSGAASKELLILSDSERSPGGRPVHEPDPHLPVMWRQLVRLPDRTAAACPGTGCQPGGMDALELPRHPAARLTSYDESRLAEKDPLRPGRMIS